MAVDEVIVFYFRVKRPLVIVLSVWIISLDEQILCVGLFVQRIRISGVSLDYLCSFKSPGIVVIVQLGNYLSLAQESPIWDAVVIYPALSAYNTKMILVTKPTWHTIQ